MNFLEVVTPPPAIYQYALSPIILLLEKYLCLIVTFQVLTNIFSDTLNSITCGSQTLNIKQPKVKFFITYGLRV